LDDYEDYTYLTQHLREIIGEARGLDGEIQYNVLFEDEHVETVRNSLNLFYFVLFSLYISSLSSSLALLFLTLILIFNSHMKSITS